MGERCFSRGRRTAERSARLYYDAQCSLCAAAARWIDRLDILDSLEFCTSLDHPARRAGLGQLEVDRAAWLVTSAGATYEGFHAFRRLALYLPPLWPLTPLLWLPGVAPCGVRLYRWVADHRATISRCHRHVTRGQELTTPANRRRGLTASP